MWAGVSSVCRRRLRVLRRFGPVTSAVTVAKGRDTADLRCRATGDGVDNQSPLGKTKFVKRVALPNTPPTTGVEDVVP